MELEQAVYSPELGVPIAIALHALSLLSQIMLPGSSFAIPFVSSTYAPSSQLRGKTHLFSQHRRSDDRKSYSAHLGRLLAAQRMAAQRYAVRRTTDPVACAFACIDSRGRVQRVPALPSATHVPAVVPRRKSGSRS